MFITVPGMLIGAVFCCTIIGIPLGLIIMALACKPVANAISLPESSAAAVVIEEEPTVTMPNRADRFKELFSA